jgi:amine sulfotransferase
MFFDPTIMHNLEDLKRFPVNDEDVFIVGFPKSGTSWLQVMVTNLWDDWGVCQTDDRRVPSLHGVEIANYLGYEAALACPSPRLVKTHIARYCFPDRWPEHGRVIHIVRNPKDVCVSLFHELNNLWRAKPESPSAVDDLDTLVDRFVAGEVPFGPFADNVLSWLEFDHPSMLKLTYESARVDTRATLERVVEFVGRPTEPGRIDEVVRTTEFEAMRKSQVRFQINSPDLREDSSSPFMRRGVVGGWRDTLTVAQSDRIDAAVVSQLEAGGLSLTYA